MTLLYPVVAAGVVVDSLGREWDPLKHPRDRKGKFIHTFRLVRAFLTPDGTEAWATGNVENVNADGSIRMRVEKVSDPANEHYIGELVDVTPDKLENLNEKATLGKGPAAAPGIEKWNDFLSDDNSTREVFENAGYDSSDSYYSDFNEAKRGLEILKDPKQGINNIDVGKRRLIGFWAWSVSGEGKAHTSADFMQLLESLGVDPDVIDDTPDGASGYKALLDQINAGHSPNVNKKDSEAWFNERLPNKPGVLREQQLRDSDVRIRHYADGKQSVVWPDGTEKQHDKNKGSLRMAAWDAHEQPGVNPDDEIEEVDEPATASAIDAADLREIADDIESTDSEYAEDLATAVRAVAEGIDDEVLDADESIAQLESVATDLEDEELHDLAKRIFDQTAILKKGKGAVTPTVKTKLFDEDDDFEDVPIDDSFEPDDADFEEDAPALPAEPPAPEGNLDDNPPLTYVDENGNIIALSDDTIVKWNGYAYVHASEASDDELESVDAYAGNDVYLPLNKALRTGTWDSIPEDYQNIGTDLDNLMARSRTRKDMKLYRGVKSGLNPETQAQFQELVSKLEVGATIFDDGFVSTSRSEQVGQDFAQGHPSYIVYEMDVPEGTPAIDIAAYLGYSNDPSVPDNGLALDESEILLARGLGLEITDVTKSGDGWLVKGRIVGPNGADEGEESDSGQELPGGEAEVPGESEGTPGGDSSPSAGSPAEEEPEAQDQVTYGDTPYTSDQLDSIDEYVTDSSAINKALRVGSLDDETQEHVDNIDAAFNAEMLPTGTTLYRGMNFDPDDEFLATLKPGAVIDDKAYVSTSQSKSASTNFSSPQSSTPRKGVLIEVVTDREIPAINIGAMYDDGEDDIDETEHLLPRGTGFQIESVEEIDGVINVKARILLPDEVPDSAVDVAPEWNDDDTVGEPDEAPGGLVDASDWHLVSGQGGSNPGGTYQDENGNRHYVKASKSEDHARNESVAADFYKEAGIFTAQQNLAKTPYAGKLGTSSPIIPGAKQDLSTHVQDKEYLDKLRDGFAVDAWLANWDVAGLELDNIVTDGEGDPVRIDPGGALWFRAMGAPKGESFGENVVELETFKTHGKAKVLFKDITPEQERASAQRVLDISPERIDELVDAKGFTGDGGVDPERLKTILKARREFIADHYGMALPEAQTGDHTPSLPVEDVLDAELPDVNPTAPGDPWASMLGFDNLGPESSTVTVTPENWEDEGTYELSFDINDLDLGPEDSWADLLMPGITVTDEDNSPPDPSVGDPGYHSVTVEGKGAALKMAFLDTESMSPNNFFDSATLVTPAPEADPDSPGVAPNPDPPSGADAGPGPGSNDWASMTDEFGQYRWHPSGVKLRIGDTVRSTKDGLEGTITKFEKNHDGVVVVDPTGKKKARKIKTMDIISAAEPEKNAAPTPAPAPTPDVVPNVPPQEAPLEDWEKELLGVPGWSPNSSDLSDEQLKPVEEMLDKMPVSDIIISDEFSGMTLNVKGQMVDIHNRVRDGVVDLDDAREMLQRLLDDMKAQNDSSDSKVVVLGYRISDQMYMYEQIAIQNDENDDVWDPDAESSAPTITPPDDEPDGNPGMDSVGQAAIDAAIVKLNQATQKSMDVQSTFADIIDLSSGDYLDARLNEIDLDVRSGGMTPHQARDLIEEISKEIDSGDGATNDQLLDALWDLRAYYHGMDEAETKAAIQYMKDNGLDGINDDSTPAADEPAPTDVKQDVLDVRAQIPSTFPAIVAKYPGIGVVKAKQFRNAGFALDDADKLTPGSPEWNKVIDKALYNLDQAAPFADDIKQQVQDLKEIANGSGTSASPSPATGPSAGPGEMVGPWVKQTDGAWIHGDNWQKIDPGSAAWKLLEKKAGYPDATPPVHVFSPDEQPAGSKWAPFTGDGGFTKLENGNWKSDITGQEYPPSSSSWKSIEGMALAPTAPSDNAVDDVPANVPMPVKTGPNKPGADGKPIYIGDQVKSTSDGEVYTVVKFEANGTGAVLLGKNGKKARKLNKLVAMQPIKQEPAKTHPEHPMFGQPQPTPPKSVIDDTDITYVNDEWLDSVMTSYNASTGKDLTQSKNYPKYVAVIEKGDIFQLDQLKNKGFISEDQYQTAYTQISASQTQLSEAIEAEKAAKLAYAKQLDEWAYANGYVGADHPSLFQLKGHNSGEKKFASNGQGHTWGTNIWKEYNKTITSAQRDALHSYTGSGYTTINGKLQDAKENSLSGVGVTTSVLAIDAYLENAPRLPEDTTVVRGNGFTGWIDPSTGQSVASLPMGAKEAAMLNMKGTLQVNWGFQSATPGAYPGYSAHKPVWMYIRMPAGTKAGYVSAGGASAQDEGEHEILLARGYRYYVHNVYQGVPPSAPSYGQKWIVEVELVPPGWIPPTTPSGSLPFDASNGAYMPGGVGAPTIVAPAPSAPAI